MTTTATALEVKARAKAIFCLSYGYPAVPFRSLGRSCFASCMKAARLEMQREAAKAARVAALAFEERAARIASLRSDLALADFIDSTTERIRVIATAKAELAEMAA